MNNDDKEPIDITQGVKGFSIGVGFCAMMLVVLALAGCSGTIDRNGLVSMSYGIDADTLTYGNGTTYTTGTR